MNRITPPAPGIYEAVPYDVYDSWDAFRSSYVSALLRSPRHWLYEQQHPRESDSMTFGSMVDCLITEPGEFDGRFAVRPATYTDSRGVEKKWTLASNTCKEIDAAIQKSGKEPVNQADVERARNAAEATVVHPLIAAYRKTSAYQVCLVWTDEQTGCACKARLDIMAGTPAILDLKTTRNASREAFRRDLSFFGYHVQAGLYQSGYAALHGGICPPVNLVAIESEPPHGVAVYPVGPDSLATGLIRARQAMELWQAVRTTGKHPGYPVYADEIEILPYMIDQSVREFTL